LHLFTETNFKKIILPNVEFISGAYMFDGNNKSALEEVHLPKWLGSGGGYAFMDGNPNLRLVDLGMANPVYMRNCPNLKTLIIRKTTVPVLGGHNAWSGTPFSPDDGTGGYVYVPQSLISAYQSNAGWQQHMNVLEFRPIEGSEYELEE
jgi:hypothetical protein